MPLSRLLPDVALPRDITVSGLVMARLGRIPAVGDSLVVELPQRIDHDGKPVPTESVRLTVQTIERRVPGIVLMERVA